MFYVKFADVTFQQKKHIFIKVIISIRLNFANFKLTLVIKTCVRRETQKKLEKELTNSEARL